MTYDNKYQKNDVELRMNFLSIDGKAAMNSYGEIFKIAQEVGHEGAEEGEFAIINSFKIDKKRMEIEVKTTKGDCHLDFIFGSKYKISRKTI